ncbi:hypothetical protein B0J13DRAFT_586377 [Dactylonectria estremocensis]|uniref:Uncharacterized protein n=1 Tax=Dactylonectria estremocensis TaxID=1079267 RepID=A0A9P9ELU3_9HYPO|nr:hypothetical protein B0J13DRAFT_586377 [Dactylonectria estremocensis]
MWPEEAPCFESKSLESRENELLVNRRYFGSLVAKGATAFRYSHAGHSNTVKGFVSAQDIADHLISRLEIHTPDVLQLQLEIIDEKKTLGETAAGKTVAEDLNKARIAYKQELKGLEVSIKGQLPVIYASRLREQKADVDKKLEAVDHNRRALKKTMQDLHKEEERVLRRKVEEADKHLRIELSVKEKKLMDVEETLRKRKGKARQDKAGGSLETRQQQPGQQQEKKIESQKQSKKQQKGQLVAQIQQLDKKRQQIRSMATEHESHERAINEMKKEIGDLRKGLLETRDAYQRFQSQTTNVWGGSINGVASGVASGLVAVAVSAATCVVM